MRSTLLLAFLVFLLTTCKQPNPLPAVAAEPAFVTDLPKWSKEHPFWMEYKRERQELLNLETLEHGYDSIEIRIWTVPLGYLTILKYQHSKWTGYLYDYYEGMDREDAFRTSAKIHIVNPRSGWPKFIAALNEKQITTLPDMHDIEGLTDNVADGFSYDIEISTPKMYRFYSYHMPELFQQYPQARNMTDILDLLDKELYYKEKK